MRFAQFVLDECDETFPLYGEFWFMEAPGYLRPSTKLSKNEYFIYNNIKKDDWAFFISWTGHIELFRYDPDLKQGLKIKLTSEERKAFLAIDRERKRRWKAARRKEAADYKEAKRKAQEWP